jgi:LysM repeat protein
MSIRPKVLMQAAGIFLSLILAPGTAHLQEQKTIPAQQQEQAVEVPAQQQPEATAPEANPTAEPANQEPGKSVAPAEDKAAAGPAETTEPAPAQEKTSQYIIKQGDTLWDISNAFLKDPFLWPFIWKANPLITNPDLIYPGNKLAIPSLAPIERALNAPVEAPKEQVVEKKAPEVEAPIAEEPQPTQGIAAGVIKPKPVEPAPGEETASTESGLILPEEQPKPIIDKYAMLRAGYVNDDKAEDKIIGSPEDSKTAFGYDDTVYVKIQGQENVNVGDKFLIYTPLNTVKHPETGKRFGKLIKVLGILRITAKDSPKTLTARITLSFDIIEKNSMLTPYQEPALIFDSPQKKIKDISGYILEVTDKRTINAQLDFVYLDKGNADGVEPGDRFIVYAEPDKKSLPRKVIGEVQVFLVKEKSSTAVVRKSTDTLTRGDKIEYKK